jgi:tetratricopeptide (TPR) repeat protein
MLPDGPERTQRELLLRSALGAPLMATIGYGASEAEENYSRARELCQQSGESAQLLPALMGLCTFYVMRADLRTARELAEQVLRVARSDQSSGLLIESNWITGQTDEALAALDEALVDIEISGERRDEAEIYRIKGELLLISGAQTEAEGCFRQAIDFARKQQAKSWELRAAMSLARLHQSQGDKEQARQTLAEILAWFTEGFGTADLIEARAIIAALS